MFQIFSKHDDQTIEFENILSFPEFKDIFLARLWGNSRPHTLQMRMKNAHSPVGGISKYLAKLHIHLPFEPAISPPEIYPKDTLGKIHKHVCIILIIMTLVIIAKDWEQPKGLSKGG